MRQQKIALLLFLVVFGFLCGAAQANEMFSPMLPAIAPPDNVECRIINVDTHPHTVVVQSLDINGAITGNLVQDLNPGQAGVLSQQVLPAMYCKFIVEGSKDNYRASIDVFNPLGFIRVALPAF